MPDLSAAATPRPTIRIGSKRSPRRPVCGSVSMSGECAARSSGLAMPGWSSSRSSPDAGRVSRPGGFARLRVGYRDGDDCRHGRGSGSTAGMIFNSADRIRTLTPQYEGERLPDGRPFVPDDILERMKLVTNDEAWGVLERGHDYHFNFEGDWVNMHPERVLVGRAVTVRYVPTRPD